MERRREGFSPRAAPILRRLLRWDTLSFTSTRTKNIGISCTRTINRSLKTPMKYYTSAAKLHNSMEALKTNKKHTNTNNYTNISDRVTR